MLVVDPEPTAIAAILKGAGYRVRDTESFAEAVEIVRASDPRIDLVICRYELGPDITGIEFIEGLLEISSDLQYILLSFTRDNALLLSDPGFQKHSAHFMLARPRVGFSGESKSRTGAMRLKPRPWNLS